MGNFYSNEASQHPPLFKIVVVGAGFAASYCAMALSQSLSNKYKLSFVCTSKYNSSDALYGTLCSPDAYKNNLKWQISEPELMLNTSTTFSFGNRYVNWGKDKLDWFQCFHLPFPVEAGVHFHHFMTRHKANLNDFLISAQAGQRARFAHPPENKPESALARAEYAYHFDPAEWSRLFAHKIDSTKTTIINSSLVAVNVQGDRIQSIDLENGQHIEADLFIDCSGLDKLLLSQLTNNFALQRVVTMLQHEMKVQKTGPSYRQVSGTQDGWQSVTALQGRNIIQRLKEADETESNSPAQNNNPSDIEFKVKLGKNHFAWLGNCVGVGHSAYSLEPITPAPYMLLTRDVERLLELIPLSLNMDMESKEYNRRYRNDLQHAELFHKALYYQQQDVGFGACKMLERKINQFCHRGVLANFDLEPFNDEDWIILHSGMGRNPKYYYKMADQISEQEMATKLEHMRKGIAHLASQMPPHHIYLEKFLQYLRQNNVTK